MLERRLPEKRRLEIERELETPPLPKELLYLWTFYRRLHKRRASGGFGPNPISWTEIKDFLLVAGERLSAWEVELIEMLDDLWLDEVARARRDHLEELRSRNKNRAPQR